MPHFGKMTTDLLNIGSQPAGGDAEVMVEAALNRSYRKAQRLSNNLNAGRTFSLTTVAKLTPDAAVFTGSGLNDGTSGGTYSGTNRAVWNITIDGVGGTDTFSWDIDGGTATTGVSMTGGAQTLSLGITVTFAATTGHSIGDKWVIVNSMYSQYGMPLYVARTKSIIDRTNNRRVDPISSEEYDNSYPDTTNTGDPFYYYIFGIRGLQTQPTSASTIVIVSDVNSDNAIMRVTGFNASDVLISEEMTLNGTTGVTSAKTYDSIERIVKGTTSSTLLTGNITVTDGTTTLGVIPFWTDSPDYTWIEFYPIPKSATTYTVRADMYKTPLVHTQDWPEIPEDYHDYLVYDAGSEVLGPFGKPEIAAAYSGKATQAERKFRGSANSNPDNQLVFADVQSGTTMLPRRPLIKNIDFV